MGIKKIQLSKKKSIDINKKDMYSNFIFFYNKLKEYYYFSLEPKI